MARQNKRRRGNHKSGGATNPRTTSTAGPATGARKSNNQATRANGQPAQNKRVAAPVAPMTLEAMLRGLGAETELIEHEVFDGTHQAVAHLRHKPSVVRNVNQEAHDRLSTLDRVALFITERVGTFGFFLIILGWTIFWLLWNSLAPAKVRFDPGPAFVFWLFISNMIQIFLMPLLMVGQNLQGRHSELRAQADFEVNTKAEREVEAILLHLENQAAQIQRQGELMLQILQHLEALHTTPAAEQAPSATATAASLTESAPAATPAAPAGATA